MKPFPTDGLELSTYRITFAGLPTAIALSGIETL